MLFFLDKPSLYSNGVPSIGFVNSCISTVGDKTQDDTARPPGLPGPIFIARFLMLSVAKSVPVPNDDITDCIQFRKALSEVFRTPPNLMFYSFRKL